MEKISFLIYLNYEEQFNLLSDEQAGQLIKAIISYEKTGEEPVIDDGMVKIAFSFIKQQLDRDDEKWLEEKKKRSEAGRRGMASRWENSDNAVIEDDNKNSNVITNDNKDNTVIKSDNKNNSVKNVITRDNKNN